jgi:hypothetical protein
MKITFTTTQLEIMQELANYINLKGLIINSEKDMLTAFSKYLQSNATNYYLKADDFDKKQFRNNIKFN